MYSDFYKLISTLLELKLENFKLKEEIKDLKDKLSFCEKYLYYFGRDINKVRKSTGKK